MVDVSWRRSSYLDKWAEVTDWVTWLLHWPEIWSGTIRQRKSLNIGQVSPFLLSCENQSGNSKITTLTFTPFNSKNFPISIIIYWNFWNITFILQKLLWKHFFWPARPTFWLDEGGDGIFFSQIWPEGFVSNQVLFDCRASIPIPS